MDDTRSRTPPAPEMTPSNAHTTTKDLPVKLTLLDQALQPFRHSYIHTDLIFFVFNGVLDEVYKCYKKYPDALPLAGYHQQHIHIPWNDYLDCLRDPASFLYADPESLQVAQLMAKQDPVRIWFELDSHVRQDIIGGSPRDVVMDLGLGYTKVERGLKWLVECATLSLSKEFLWTDEKDTAMKNLATVATCGPQYCLSELDPTLPHSLELFGPGGVLWSAMEVFTREPGDYSGIVAILDMVIQQTLNVALLFRYSWEHHARVHDQRPAYKWYARGLEESQTKFVYSVECQDPQGLLPYHVRDGLKKFDFIGLWDAIWKKAYDLSGILGVDPRHLEFNMYLWAVQQMSLPSSDPRPWIPHANVALITEMRCNWYGMYRGGVLNIATGGLYAPPEDFHVSNFFYSLDAGAMPYSHMTRFLPFRRGHRFYDENDDLDTSDADDEQEFLGFTIDDTADVEPYGPLLDLTDLATATTTVPEDQCCTICMENHFHSSSNGHGGTMKLNSCGHLFHYDCIFEWLNGTSSNSNLCPECRIQFSEQRRPVRPVQPASVSSSESDSTWVVSSDESEAEEERSLEPISQQNRAEGDALNETEETSAHRDTAAQPATTGESVLETMTRRRGFIVYEGDANRGDNDEEENDHDDPNDPHDTSSSTTSSPDAGLSHPQENVSVPRRYWGQNRILSIDYSATWDGRAFSDGPNDEDEEGVGEMFHDYDRLT